ncbi:MurR/RpiR family transcriptional regulator [Rhizobium rhizogenes]|uniref:MurR/RpiR family transcriptional regulator n=1 Tax=Rhizobium rhizogenes TaxID=359 RepID=UPI001574006A|nr:MurR/RpiR family transcriptional regulator [Rhizobium rhizogenes]NTF46260.1 MurR/RpiR family transcriptional regulator [Rhizobium rhizogenes]
MDDHNQKLLEDRFQQHKSKLSRSELAVVEYLLATPLDILIFESAEDIAAKSGTSDATVIRAARRLGFTGLPELKRLCSRNMAKSIPTTERLSQRFRATGDDLGTITKRIFSTVHEIMTSSEEKLDVDALAHTMQLLDKADTVWCLGMGRSEVEAKHCAIALSRVGLRTRHSGSSGFVLANELIDLRADDVVIVFQTARDTAELRLVVNQVSELDCRVVLVCGVQLTELYRDRVSAVLTCVGSATGLASWTLGAIVVADILAYGIAARNQERALKTRKRLAQLREHVPK